MRKSISRAESRSRRLLSAAQYFHQEDVCHQLIQYMKLDPLLLPSIAEIRKRSQALAMLDAILCPEWEDRYFSFNAHWGEGEQMGSMRNGSGDEWFILFGAFGAAIKGVAHESEMASNSQFSQEIQRQVPHSFASFLHEPAFSMQSASYCYWRAASDETWHQVMLPDAELAKADDGSAEYLALLIEPASSFVEYVNAYYELDIPLEIAERIYAYQPLDRQTISTLNGQIVNAEAEELAAEIGYPVARLDA